MQWAVTAAIGTALGGATSQFSSLYYQTLFERDEDDTELRDFPYDMPFLSPQELYKLAQAGKDYNCEFWPIERIQAARGKNLIAKRAAHSPFLWERYQALPSISLSTLKLWWRIEQIEKLLHVPDWFRQQRPMEDNLEKAWNAYLGDRRGTLESKHRELMALLLEA